MNINHNVIVISVKKEAYVDPIKQKVKDLGVNCRTAIANGNPAVAATFTGAGIREKLLTIAKSFALPEVIEIDSFNHAYLVNQATNKTESLGIASKVESDAPIQPYVQLGDQRYGFANSLKKAS